MLIKEEVEDQFHSVSVRVLEIMIGNQEEEVDEEEGMIDSQEEQIEDELLTLVTDKEDRLDNLDLLDREDLSVNLVTLDNLNLVDKEDSLDRGNQDHLE